MCIATASSESRTGLKWLTRPPATRYTHRIGTSQTGTPSHPARERTSVSYPYRPARHCNSGKRSSGYTRSPHWLSLTRTPLSSRTIRFENARPNRLRHGYSAPSIGRAPPTRASGIFRDKSINAGTSPASCCPSVSIVTACVNPSRAASSNPLRIAIAFPRFRSCLSTRRTPAPADLSQARSSPSVPSVDPSFTTITPSPSAPTARSTPTTVRALLKLGATTAYDKSLLDPDPPVAAAAPSP